jgi:hypothetical protein
MWQVTARNKVHRCSNITSLIIPVPKLSFGLTSG